jgi:hypothetical protein
MASFISALPAPRHTAIDEDDDEDFFAMQAARGGAPPPPRKKIPAYGARAGFIPRSNEDFGEGGAYPEVHVAQYPLNMGRCVPVRCGDIVLNVTREQEGRQQRAVLPCADAGTDHGRDG